MGDLYCGECEFRIGIGPGSAEILAHHRQTVHSREAKAKVREDEREATAEAKVQAAEALAAVKEAEQA